MNKTIFVWNFAKKKKQLEKKTYSLFPVLNGQSLIVSFPVKLMEILHKNFRSHFDWVVHEKIDM